MDGWLLELEAAMRATIKSHISTSLSQYPADLGSDSSCFSESGSWHNWFRSWEGQVVLAVSHIVWTAAITKALSVTGNVNIQLLRY